MDTFTIVSGMVIYAVLVMLIISLFKFSPPETAQLNDDRRSNDRRKNPASRRSPERDALCGDRRHGDRRMMMGMSAA